MTGVSEIRQRFRELYRNKEFTVSRLGDRTVEIVGASFVADQTTIFGEINLDYANAEIEWYNLMSTNIWDIYGESSRRKPPEQWIMSADKEGNINSNYGYLIYHRDNYSQYTNCLMELVENADSRRATMIYQRPNIHYDYRAGGKNDFICTNAVTYYIRDNKLHCVVQMRSNDAVYGYKNDLHWQKHVLYKLRNEYNEKTDSLLIPGNIYWQVQNLHVYERHFKFLEPVGGIFDDE